MSRSHLPEKMAGIQVDHLLSSLTAPISDFLLRIVSYDQQTINHSAIHTWAVPEMGRLIISLLVSFGKWA